MASHQYQQSGASRSGRQGMAAATTSGSRQGKGAHDYASVRQLSNEEQLQALGHAQKQLMQKQVRSNMANQQRQQHQSQQMMNGKAQKQQSQQLSSQGSAGFNPVQFFKNQVLQSRASHSPARPEVTQYQEHASGRQQTNQSRRTSARKVGVSSSNNSKNTDKSAQNGRNQQAPDSNGSVQSQSLIHHQRNKFKGSFLANHNSKAIASANNNESSSTKQVSAGAQLQASAELKTLKKATMMIKPGQGAPQQKVQLACKSPIAIANPSTFTITTTTQNNFAFNSNSPMENQQLGSKGSGGSQRGFGSNPSSVKHNSTKHSDQLQNTEQSTNLKQRENIKVFSFKPSNIKVQNKQLNVASLKTSHISLNKESAIGAKAKTRVHTMAQPSPTGGFSQEHKIQISKTGRNRSSGSDGMSKVKMIMAKPVMKVIQGRSGSSDGTVSNESKRQQIIMQPNIIKKPLMNGSSYQRDDSADMEEFNTPDHHAGAGPTTLRTVKKILQPSVRTTQTSKRHSSQHSGGVNSTELSSSRPQGGTNIQQQHQQYAQNTGQTTAKRIKIVKKRGQSENVHTDTSNHRNSMAGNALFLNSQLSLQQPKQQQQAPQKLQQQQSQPQKKSTKGKLQARGNSLPTQEINQRLGQLQQEQEAMLQQTKYDHKEVIVNHIRQYIKLKPASAAAEPGTLGQLNAESGEKGELIIQNLREFLIYLENKNIINPQKLQDKNEMKNFIKDIMKLDLSKFSKPRSSSMGQQPQQRQPKHSGSAMQHAGEVNMTKKRKVLPSPTAHAQAESRTAPTQFSAATNSSQTSIACFARVNEQLKAVKRMDAARNKLLNNSNVEKIMKVQVCTKTSKETSASPNPVTIHAKNLKFEYASQPKYLNYGKLNIKQKSSERGQRSTHENSASSASPNKTNKTTTNTSESRMNISGVNFLLPSNRTVNRNANAKDNIHGVSNTDCYGVKSMQVSLISGQSPDPHSTRRQQQSQQQQKFKVQHSSKSSQQDSKNVVHKAKNIHIDSKEGTIVKSFKVKRSSVSREQCHDGIAVEEQLQQMRQTTQKPRLYTTARGSKTAAPNTAKQSPRQEVVSQSQRSRMAQHQKMSSQPNLSHGQMAQALPHEPQQIQTSLQPQQQQVPTIQLMINTNGQGKVLGINVNNYCFAPAAQDASKAQPQSDLQAKQLQQLLQMQNNNSAEQLHHSGQISVANIQKQYQQGIKTEPDQQQLMQHYAAAYEANQHVNYPKNERSNMSSKVSSVHNSGELNRMQKNQPSRAVNNHGLVGSHDRSSSEFQIADDSSNIRPAGYYFDNSQQEQAGFARYNGKLSHHQTNKRQQQQQIQHSQYPVMMIQDDMDDENTGGNGAEAKMSPTAMGSSGQGLLTQSKLMNSVHQTPLVNTKNQKVQQSSSSNRGGSGRSSQHNSSLNSRVFDIDKSQIQASVMSSKMMLLEQQRQRAQSKESQHDGQVISAEILLLSKKEQQKELRAEKPRSSSQMSNVIPTAPPTAKNSPTEAAVPSRENSRVVLNDSVTEDREKLVKYITSYVTKHGKIPHTTLDFYKFVKLLGKGAFGKITLGIHKLTGKYVAIKSIDKVNIKDEYSRRKVFQEVYILKKIRHSCVIRLLEVFESEKHFLMVMEYSGGGDLLQYVKKRRRLNEQSAKAIFKQILYALGHCHCRSVLHRDIKLDNVLMDGEGGVKLCDFGVSRIVKKGNTINEQCGTPAYLAPEIIHDQGYQGFSADVWSLGVLLYAMVQGTVPFKAHNIADLHKLILKGDFEFPVDTVSDDVKDLVTKMLVLDPKDRISIPQMLNHAWVSEMQRGPGDDILLEDSEHDLRVGSTFFREEVLGGLISGCKSDGNENGNINFVNVENLYYRGGPPAKDPQTDPDEKVTYSDYCALTEDFMTYRIDEEAMDIVTGFGYPRQLVLESINRGDVNHATAAYYLLVY